MKIKELYKDNEEITIESYLEKFGISDAEEYINPTGKYLDDCMAYPNMREAVQDFKWHYLRKDSAYILSDSGDTDGITSTCIMYEYMKLLNPNWNIKILLHKNKERGLADDVLFEQIYNEPRDLLIIPDSGTSDRERVRTLTEEKGITVIVLDHHQSKTPIEQGDLVTNQIGDVDRNGSGCLVTHKFLQALDKEFNVKYSRQFIDMVALSIISDSMNITSQQNRTYLYYGLFSPNPLMKNEFLKALFDRFMFNKDFTIRDVSFKIVPKLNSICRCGEQDIKQRVYLAFLGLDDIDEVCDICEDYHKKQVTYVNNYVKDNKDKIDDSNNIIVFTDNNIKPSYNGLLAGKFEDAFNKPCVIGKMFNNTINGSLRSPVDIYDYINDSGIAELQGHKKACGVKLPIENLDSFYELVNQVDINQTEETEVVKSFYTSDIPDYLFSEFSKYKTLFGTKDLPTPIFHIKNIKIKTEDITVMKEKHLKFKYKDVEFLYFNTTKAEREEIFKNKALNIEVIGELSINEWRGRQTNQVIIDKIEVTKRKLEVEDLF